MARPVFLAGERINLCPLDPADDLADYTGWVNDQDTTRYMGAGKAPMTASQVRAYVERYGASGEFLLGIFVKETGRHVGNIALHSFDRQNRHAETGIMVGDAGSRGKGYGLEAMRLLCRHAFQRMNLNKVTAGVVEGNKASLRLFEKAGFQREGLLREHFFLDGQYQNYVKLGLLRSDLA